MSITVRYYDGVTAVAQQATLSHQGEYVLLSVAHKHLHYKLKQLKIHPKLGHALATIDLPDGGYVELLQADVPEWLYPSQQQRVFWQRLWVWENKLHYIAISMIGILMFVFVLVQYGIPRAAKYIAYSLPDATEQLLAKHTLASLDKILFTPTKVPVTKQQHIQQLFQQTFNPPPQIQLVFRESKIGANALALPNGTIVMTDDLLTLAENDYQLLAVLAHELGHIEGRHGLRSALSVAGIGIVVGGITGDIDSMVSAMPTIFLQLRYSRDFELEADEYAHQSLTQHNIPLHHFADILIKLSKQHDDDSNSSSNDYWQTHPHVQERVKPFLKSE